MARLRASPAPRARGGVPSPGPPIGRIFPIAMGGHWPSLPGPLAHAGGVITKGICCSLSCFLERGLTMMNNTPDPNDLLTPSDAARVLGLSADSVRVLSDSGRLPAMRTISGRRLFRRMDVESAGTPAGAAPGGNHGGQGNRHRRRARRRLARPDRLEPRGSCVDEARVTEPWGPQAGPPDWDRPTSIAGGFGFRRCGQPSATT